MRFALLPSGMPICHGWGIKRSHKAPTLVTDENQTARQDLLLCGNQGGMMSKQVSVNTKRPVKTTGQEQTELKLPHETDESPDEHATKPRDVMHQAYKDIEQGQMDTDRRGMPGVEEVQRKRAGQSVQQEIPASSRMPPSTPKK
jgi:hypothetical protein